MVIVVYMGLRNNFVFYLLLLLYIWFVVFDSSFKDPSSSTFEANFCNHEKVAQRVILLKAIMTVVMYLQPVWVWILSG